MHFRIAKGRDAKTSPNRTDASLSKLTPHFGSRSCDLTVFLRHMIGIDVCDVRPIETDRIEHERNIVERPGDFSLDRNADREIKRIGTPAALAG